MTKINLPTKITLARICAIPLIIVLYVLQKEISAYLCIATALLYIATSATDFVDGYLARKNGMVTTLGKFLDPIADKVVVLTGIFVIVDGNMITVPYVAMICGVVIVARELIIGLFRQIAAIKNYVLAADGLGKVKTATTMTAIGTLLFTPLGGTFGTVVMYVGMAILIAATVLTVWSGVHYVTSNKGLFTDGENGDENGEGEEEETACGDTAEGAAQAGDREEK